MSVRYVWIIQLPGTQTKAVKVLFTRKFPTVEKRAQVVGKTDYVKVLPDPHMARLIVQEIGYGPVGKKFVAERDSCREQLQKPVFKVKTDEGEIWPLLILQQGDLLLCCLPLVESGHSSANNNLIDIKDCIRWGLLPPATQAMRTQSKLAKGRFTGDPAYEYEHTTTKKVGEGEEATEEEETITIKEEDRLSSIIAEIDEDVRIVPRAAFIKTPTGNVVSNRSFEGLSVAESSKLCNYMHFREPIVLNQKSLLQRANLDKAIDFMDNLEEDIPRGSWALQFERGSGLVVLRSLLWPGYVFYHVPGTRCLGSVYFGNGEKNLDLPFML